MKGFERRLDTKSDAANCRNNCMSRCRSFNTDQSADNFRVPHNNRMLSAITGIQGVPGVKVTTSGVTSLGDAESKTSYTHGSNSQRFRIYEVRKKLERKEEHCAFIEKYSYRFVVRHSS